MTRSRTGLTAWAGIVGGALAAGLVTLASAPALTLAGALALACVPAGAAVMCHVDSGDGVAQAALTLVLSLAGFALASTVMIWAAWWHPRALLALAGLSVASGAVRLARGAPG